MTAAQWALAVAVSLPPLTPEQAADIGRIAAAIDARKAGDRRDAA